MYFMNLTYFFSKLTNFFLSEARQKYAQSNSTSDTWTMTYEPKRMSPDTSAIMSTQNK